MSDDLLPLSEAEISVRLVRGPHWYYENGWIRRKYRTGGWKGTLMVVNVVGHLAEAAWHRPGGVLRLRDR